MPMPQAVKEKKRSLRILLQLLEEVCLRCPLIVSKWFMLLFHEITILFDSHLERLLLMEGWVVILFQIPELFLPQQCHVMGLNIHGR